MKRQRWKLLLTVICVLAAGICYSGSRQSPSGSGQGDGGVLYLDRWTEEDGQMPEVSAEAFGENAEMPSMPVEAEPTENAETSAESAQAGQIEKALEKSICYVHICGAVNSPGVYELEEGSRVFQAVEEAGGFAEDACQGYLNLALEVTDGMKIVVPTEAEVTESAGTKDGWPGIYRADGFGAGSSGVSSDGKVNLNTATKEELMTLKGIGEARAEDILRYRREQGPFSSIEDIKKVSGIKDAAFQRIKDDITV